jgi:dienelactone hydrolase
VTPNAFNNYIRAIEKIYDKLFNYKCSYDSNYIQKHDNFKEYFTPSNSITEQVQTAGSLPPSLPIGYFIRNDNYLNAYLYIYDNAECEFNNKKTLFITFKGSSSFNDFLHDLQSQFGYDKLLSELNTQISSVSNSKGNYVSLSQSEPADDNSQNKSNDKGKAGGGFIDVLKLSIKDLCEKIQELQKNHPDFVRVIITGHSLGGALASIFGYYLRKYKLDIIAGKPIHIVTFGACCVFDAPGRNEFNKFLNIHESQEKSIFTLDRVTVNGDPVISLPVDLDHPGFTLLKNIKVFKAYSETGRTNEIGEIREMLGLTNGYDGNDLLLLGSFVKLFKNPDNFIVSGSHDVNLYRSKFKIPLGSDAKEQQLILTKAMPDAKDDIKRLFKEIERKVANKIYNNKQDGAGPLNFVKNKYQKFKNKRQNQGSSTNEYKKETIKKMPNQINYSCYKLMTMGLCHGAYMGVSYMTALRFPGISLKNGYKPRKEPTKNYTLYQKNIGGRTIVFSKSNDDYNNKNCSTIVPKKNKTNRNSKPKSFSNKMKNSFSGLTGLFKSKPKDSGEFEMTNLEKGSEGSEKQESPGVFISKCSIL